MDQHADGQGQEMQPPPGVALLQMLTGKWITQIIYVAAKLGVALPPSPMSIIEGIPGTAG